jgi:hypothetical protein
MLGIIGSLTSFHVGEKSTRLLGSIESDHSMAMCSASWRNHALLPWILMNVVLAKRTAAKSGQLITKTGGKLKCSHYIYM